MKQDQFLASKTGQLTPVTDVPGASHAFLPDPLPPRWEWPADLWPLLVEAHKALSALDALGRHLLPNPELLLRPLQKREAQKSSNLEGTTTTPEDQLTFELDPKLPTSRTDPANATMEILNYSKALGVYQEMSQELPLSLRLIRELHRVLMDGVRGGDRSPGMFRRQQNQIDRPPRYVPPPPLHLDKMLVDFESYLHSPKKFDPLVEAFVAHYQLEAIHPFMDGNGRVGRLLLSILLQEWCGLSDQWLYMSAYFEQRKNDYIDNLLRVSTEGAWSQWIAFCLQGVVVQAHDTIHRCEQLIDLRQRFHDQVNAVGGSLRLSQLIDELLESPVVVVANLAKRYRVTYPTANRDVEKLAGLGILSRLEGSGRKAYYCSRVVNVIYGD